jgi:WD40 repeat protein
MGRYILSGGDDGTLRVWDLATGNQVQQLRGSDVPVIGIAATLDGRYVVSVGSTAKHFGDVISNVAVWACDSWNVVWRATPDITFGPLGVPTFGAFRAPAVTPDGRYVVVAKFGSPVRRAVLVWELATGNEVRRFETDKQFYCLAVTPDGGVFSMRMRGWDGAGVVSGLRSCRASLGLAAPLATMIVPFCLAEPPYFWNYWRVFD